VLNEGDFQENGIAAAVCCRDLNVASRRHRLKVCSNPRRFDFNSQFNPQYCDLIAALGNAVVSGGILPRREGLICTQILIAHVARLIKLQICVD
jgi:hypothetical protein